MRPTQRNYQNQQFSRSEVPAYVGRRLVPTEFLPPTELSEPIAQPQFIAQPSPLSFEPPASTAPEKAVSPSPVALVLSGIAVFGAVLVLGATAMIFTGRSSAVAVKTSGRVVAVANPQLNDNDLQTSCYDLSLPVVYKVSNTFGCATELRPIHAKESNAISINAGSLTASVPLKKSLPFLMSQITNNDRANQVHDVSRADISIDGVNAVKLTYSVNKGVPQAVVYVTDLPAQYTQNQQPVGSFAINGPYDTTESQGAFDSLVESMRWVR